MDLHADKTVVPKGEPVILNLSVVNDITKDDLTVQLIIKTPSGWTWTEGIAQACTGLCSANYVIPTGLHRNQRLTIIPNQVGEFFVPATLKWFYPNEEPEQKDLSIPVTVFDPSPPPTVTVATASTATSVPTPTPTPVAANGGGCSLPPGEGGPLDASLVLLALVVPVLAAFRRTGIQWRQPVRNCWGQRQGHHNRASRK